MRGGIHLQVFLGSLNSLKRARHHAEMTAHCATGFSVAWNLEVGFRNAVDGHGAQFLHQFSRAAGVALRSDALGCPSVVGACIACCWDRSCGDDCSSCCHDCGCACRSCGRASGCAAVSVQPLRVPLTLLGYATKIALGCVCLKQPFAIEQDQKDR